MKGGTRGVSGPQGTLQISLRVSHQLTQLFSIQQLAYERPGIPNSYHHLDYPQHPSRFHLDTQSRVRNTTESRHLPGGLCALAERTTRSLFYVRFFVEGAQPSPKPRIVFQTTVHQVGRQPSITRMVFAERLYF